VVVDADQEMVFEAREPRTLYAIAFENNGGFVVSVHAVSLTDTIGKRQWLIDSWNPVAKNDFGILAHQPENLGTSEGGANSVAIGTSVRGQQKPAPFLDLLQDLV
jgi:hypothetical protein